MPYREPDSQALVRATEEADRSAALAKRAVAQRGLGRLAAQARTFGPLVGNVSLIVLMVLNTLQVTVTSGLWWGVLGLVGIQPGVAVYRWVQRRRHGARWLAELPFPVPGYREVAKKRHAAARVTAALAREPDAELAASARDLVGALPLRTLVAARGRELLFVRGSAPRSDAADWGRALVMDVLLPIHAVVPIEEARFEENLARRGLVMMADGAVYGGHEEQIGELHESYLELSRICELAEPTREQFAEMLAERRAMLVAKGAKKVGIGLFIRDGKIEIVAFRLGG